MDKIIREIEFYTQKLKEAKAKLYDLRSKQKKEIPKVIRQIIKDQWSAYQGDCVEIIKGIPSNSIHYSIFSPPFASLFTYSNSFRDMGNSKDDQFYDHFSYLIPELYRVIMPGRLASVHCCDLPLTIQSDGIIGIKDFPSKIREAFEKVGFIFHSKVVIWKDPLIQAVRTKKLELAHKQIIKDSTRCAMGYPDYIYTFRKPGENPEPVLHKNGFEYYIGERPEPKVRKNSDPAKNKYSHFIWQRYASPVWFDINQTNTLNIKLARDKEDERHICPLQLDTIARCLELWTNKEDIVLSPFAGIGSEGYKAIQMNRKAVLIELKESYFKCLVKNMMSASRKIRNFELK